MEIEIRKAEQSDVPAIAKILRELGWFAHITTETPAETQAHIARQLVLCQTDDSHLVFVAEAANGEVVGYVSVHWLPYLIHTGPEGYVSELFINNSSRGQGIGSRLLETVESEAIRRGCTRLALLNMRQRESYQREFYSKHGWEERPQAANFVKVLQDAK
ncbi:MAG: GNAT family N-acetyltransferase [Anaerolineales bacterium]